MTTLTSKNPHPHTDRNNNLSTKIPRPSHLAVNKPVKILEAQARAIDRRHYDKTYRLEKRRHPSIWKPKPAAIKQALPFCELPYWNTDFHKEVHISDPCTNIGNKSGPRTSITRQSRYFVTPRQSLTSQCMSAVTMCRLVGSSNIYRTSRGFHITDCGCSYTLQLFSFLTRWSKRYTGTR
jgi:hypothetical protein